MSDYRIRAKKRTAPQLGQMVNVPDGGHVGSIAHDEPVVVKTQADSPVTLGAGDMGKWFSNQGATGALELDEGAGIPTGAWFGMHVRAAQAMTFDPDDGNKIVDDERDTQLADGETISSSTVDHYVVLRKRDDGDWIVTRDRFGPWGATKTDLVAISGSDNWGVHDASDHPGIVVDNGKNNTANVGFTIPERPGWQTRAKGLIAIPDDDDPVGDVDIDYTAGQLDESATQHSGSDVASTYDLDADELVLLNTQTLMSAAGAKDHVGAFITNDSGAVLTVVAAQVEYF